MPRHFGLRGPAGSPPITREVNTNKSFAVGAALVLLALFSVLLLVTVARAQSSPGFIDGQVPTAAQWNKAFKDKQDFLGFTPVNKSGDVMTGPLRFSMPAPGISCDGTGTPVVSGNRQSGVLTTGTSSTTCTLTWDTAYPAAPSCVVTWRGNLAAMGYSPSPTGLTITQTAHTGSVIDYYCTGMQ